MEGERFPQFEPLKPKSIAREVKEANALEQFRSGRTTLEIWVGRKYAGSNSGNR
jgi:hypothetical protein